MSYTQKRTCAVQEPMSALGQKRTGNKRIELGALIVSEKDRRLPSLKDLDSPFAYDGAPLRPLSVPEGF